MVSDPHNVAWTFNIRGSDVAHTPLPLAFAIVPKDGRPSLYIDGRKLDNAVRDRLEELADMREPADFIDGLEALGAANANVRLDQATRRRRARRASSTAAGGKRLRAGRSDHRHEGGEERRPRSRARARRIGATARRWRAFSPGSTAKRRAAS